MRRISGLKGIQIFTGDHDIHNIITQIGVSNMHIHLNLGTRVMLYSLSILVIHRFFNYKQCIVYMQLMSKRDYTKVVRIVILNRIGAPMVESQIIESSLSGS